MWAGGPPKPVTPIRVHSRPTVASGARAPGGGAPSMSAPTPIAAVSPAPTVLWFLVASAATKEPRDERARDFNRAARVAV